MLLLSAFAVQAQNFVLLEKEGTTKRIKFQVGDQMRFKLHGSDTLYDEQISAIFDSAVAFGNFQVNYADIKQVWISKTYFWSSYLKKFSILVGVGYLGLDVFNRTINHDKPILSQSAKTVLVTSAAIATVTHLCERRWFRVKGKNRIRRLDISLN